MEFFNSNLFIVFSITIFLLQYLLLCLPIVAANDTLFPGDELTGTSTLVSSNGLFSLGFYTISPSGVKLTYLQIWHTNRGTVWVANRDLPILNGNPILKIDDSGPVGILNQNGATLFQFYYDKFGVGNNTRAMLLDSGNFIIYDRVTNRTLWESFDHPTDTLVPGMKLGYNLTAKKNWELTSGANYDCPTSGAFTMRLKQYQNSPQLLIYRHGELYWASGPWNKTTRTFQWLSYYYGFDLTYDLSGMYVMIGFGAPTEDSFPKLSSRGGFPYDHMQFCYGYGSQGYDNKSTDGCVVSELPQCRALASAVNDDVYQWEFGWNWRFSQNLHIGTNYKIDKNSSISIGDCMERCWNDCDCVACTSYNDDGTGCIYGTEHDPDEGTAVQFMMYALISDKPAEPKNLSMHRSLS